MAHYIEKLEKLTLPLVVLNGTVAFPAITVNFELSDKANVAAIEAANNVNSFIFIVSKKQISNDPIEFDKIFNIGTVAKIKQSIKTPEGKLRVIAEGFSRGTVEEYRNFANYRVAEVICKTLTLEDPDTVNVEALTREALAAVERMSGFLPASSKELISTIKTIKNPVSLSVALRELYASKNKKVVFCLNDNEQDGIDASWIWDANFNSVSFFENKIYVSANRFDDMALRLKYANVNPSLIVMEGSVRNAIQCCYWELEKNETMLILTTPSLIDEVYEILKK